MVYWDLLGFDALVTGTTSTTTGTTPGHDMGCRHHFREVIGYDLDDTRKYLNDMHEVIEDDTTTSCRSSFTHFPT